MKKKKKLQQSKGFQMSWLSFEKPKVNHSYTTIIFHIGKAFRTHSGLYKLQNATKMLCIVFLFI